jgi:hypothetical protein
MRFSPIQDGVQTEGLFRVVHVSPTSIRYEENYRSVTIPIEIHLDRSIDVFLHKVQRWNSPNERERLEDTRRQVIRFRVQSALIFEGYSPHFDPSPLFAPEGAWSVSGIDLQMAIG